MQINLSKQAGFCFGVRRALDLVEGALDSLPKPFYMFGSLVHNETVVDQLLKKGIKVVNSLESLNRGTLIITAHGSSPEIFNHALKLGLEVFDTTCPRVQDVHKIAKELEREGRKIIIYGDPEHVEVLGIIGEIDGEAEIISSFEDLKNLNLKKNERIGLISQTTQDLDEFQRIVDFVSRNFSDVKAYNTICGSTRGRQIEIKKMAKENDAIVIVGSKTSANTKRLYEIAKKLNKNTCWVANKDEVKPSWFKKINKVGISGGASTPDSVINEVTEKIKSL